MGAGTHGTGVPSWVHLTSDTPPARRHRHGGLRAGQGRALPPWEAPYRPSTPRLWLVVLGLVMDLVSAPPRLVHNLIQNINQG